jgi:hypothetical protein
MNGAVAWAFALTLLAIAGAVIYALVARLREVRAAQSPRVRTAIWKLIAIAAGAYAALAGISLAAGLNVAGPFRLALVAIVIASTITARQRRTR